MYEIPSNAVIPPPIFDRANASTRGGVSNKAYFFGANTDYIIKMMASKGEGVSSAYYLQGGPANGNGLSMTKDIKKILKVL